MCAVKKKNLETSGVGEWKLRDDKAQKTISSTYVISSKQFKADVKCMLFRI